MIDPDPEGKRVFLNGDAWLDHCHEADVFLVNFLDLLRADDALVGDANAVVAGLERVRANVTKRPHETLIKVANVGHVAWARQCVEADAAIETALDLVAAQPPSWRDRPDTLDACEGLHRVRAVVTRVTPRAKPKPADEPARPPRPPRASAPDPDAADPASDSPVVGAPASASASASTSPRLHLHYLDMKGLAEPLRLTLRLGRLPFEETVVTYDDVSKMRDADGGAGAAIPFGQVPVLEIDGVAFAQSAALLRWAGKRAGLYPDGLRQLRCDMAEECLNDLRRAFVPLWYGNSLPRNPEDGTLDPATALSDETRAAALASVTRTHLPARLRQLENLLGSTAGLESESERDAGPFLCGAYVTTADLSVYVLVEGLTHPDIPYCRGVDATEALRACPRLTALVEAVKAHPEVAAWNRERWGR